MNIIKSEDNVIENKSILTLDKLQTLNLACVFAIRNDANMKVHVSHSTNLLTSISRIMSNNYNKEFGTLNEDIETCTIDILTSDVKILDDVKKRKLVTSNYAEHYKSLGYSLYKPTNAVKYKVDICVRVFKNTSYYVVELVNTRKDKFVVGVFDNKKDTYNFTDMYYPNGVVSGLFYNTNSVGRHIYKFFDTRHTMKW